VHTSVTLAVSTRIDWLGGLDSNQDNQIQSLMYYRLYDLPAGRFFSSLGYFLLVEKWGNWGNHARLIAKQFGNCGQNAFAILRPEVRVQPHHLV
jgi:hypothetical protein